MKRRYLVPALVALVALPVTGAAGVALRSAKGAPDPSEVATASRARIAVTVQEIGVVEPLRKIDLKSKVAGQVEKVLVDVGDHVLAGDLLVRLDPLDADRETEVFDSRVAAAQAQLDEARAQLALKQRGFDRHVLAEVELSQARGDVKRLAASLRTERGERRIRRDRASYTLLRSPIDGVVLARNIQPGEIVTPGVTSVVDGKPLLVVAQLESLLVRTELNQVDVARLQLGLPARVTVDALPGKTFVGRVHRIAAMAQRSERRRDSALQVFPVDVLVDPKQEGADGLRPGMIADVVIDVAVRENVVTVPLEAVVRDHGATRLRIVRGPRVEVVHAVLGARDDARVEVVSGVNAGDVVRLPSEGEKSR